MLFLAPLVTLLPGSIPLPDHAMPSPVVMLPTTTTSLITLAMHALLTALPAPMLVVSFLALLAILLLGLIWLPGLATPCQAAIAPAITMSVTIHATLALSTALHALM